MIVCCSGPGFLPVRSFLFSGVCREVLLLSVMLPVELEGLQREFSVFFLFLVHPTETTCFYVWM